MLSVNDLIDISYIPEETDVSLELFVDFYDLRSLAEYRSRFRNMAAKIRLAEDTRMRTGYVDLRIRNHMILHRCKGDIFKDIGICLIRNHMILHRCKGA